MINKGQQKTIESNMKIQFSFTFAKLCLKAALMSKIGRINASKNK